MSVIGKLVFLGLATTLGCQGSRSGGDEPFEDWPRSTPEELGLRVEPIEELDRAIVAGDFGNVDRFVIVSDGQLIADREYQRDYTEIARGHRSYGLGAGPGEEPVEGTLPGYNYYDPNTHPFYHRREVHTLQSVTKSVAATLIGIAWGRGEIESLERPFLPYLKKYNLKQVDPRLHTATLEDLLTMRSGIEWHENDRPLDETNSCIQIERSENWVQFALDQPMDADPGEKWVYNSGGSQLLSGILRAATGEHADAYAEKHLFGPLGIQDYHWKKTPAGYADTLGGLYLASDQLAKIGHLYLCDGIWDGRRVLPEGWVEKATSRHAETGPGGFGYGYQWWRTDRDGVDIWAGLGFGGQYLFVIPDRRLVGVIQCWNIFGGGGPTMRGFIDALLSLEGN